MKRTCAYCGMFEDEDDILVCCQGPNCSLRSADCELPGVFHGRCAAALGHSGSAQGQNCPWCPPVTLTTTTVLGEFIDNFDKPQGLSAVTDEKHESDESVCGTRASEKGESNMARSQEVAVLTLQRGWRWMHKKIELRAANEERLRLKLRFNLL